MQQFFPVRVLAALAAVLFLVFLPGCGSNTTNADETVTQLVMTPTTVSLNEGAVVTLSVTAENSAGTAVAADISFTSSNPNIASVSSGGLVCGGVWDAYIINCNATLGQSGVGQATITATATAFNVSTTATVYVHEQVDQVQVLLGSSCTSMGVPINIGGEAFSTTAPGCSPSSPCNITSTVGPFTFGATNSNIAATSAGIVSTYNASTTSPTYTSGGTISGSRGQTCMLSDFNGVTNATATVALTGHNSIASGTQLTITNPGFGGTVAPTSATLSNGTATCSGTATVITALSTGVLTAENPGATTVFASVSGVNSIAMPYLTCPVNSIVVHDASSNNTTFTLNPTNTQNLTADVYDTKGVYITPTLTWGSYPTAAATVAVGTSGSNPATVTAVNGGTAYVTASCSYPSCNNGVPPQFSQNVATFNVNSPTSTSVVAASTNSTAVAFINTSTNTVAFDVSLANYPNSIVVDPGGTTVYFGSPSGVFGVTVANGTIITYDVPGTVVGITPDSDYLLVSNSSTGVISYVDISDATITGTAAGSTTSAAYTPDSAFSEFVNGKMLVLGLESAYIGTTNLPNPANALDISAQGGLTYITSAMAHEIYAYSTCNQTTTTQQTMSATAPTLIKALPNGTGAVAADSPNIDVISTPSPVSAACPVTTPSALSSFDLGAGPFTASQIFVNYDARHAWIISNLPQLLGFDVTTSTPTNVSLTGGAVPTYGGITLDDGTIYVGASDGTVHVISTSPLSDTAQIQVGLKNYLGQLTAPNLVAVVP
jgi:hypothetical protein